ncbi:MAG: HD domain-containing protein, partial [Blautia sp.]|nr:HD domain-containing protein [Blautia sp.]
GMVLGDSFAVLPCLPDASVDLVIADPPYNLDKQFGETSFRKMDTDAYREFSRRWLTEVLRILKPAGSLYVCCDWQSGMILGPLLSEMAVLRNRITWQREKGRGAAANWKNSMEDIWFATKTGEYTFHLGVFDSQGDGILEERTYSLIKEKEIYDNRWFTFYMLAVAMIAVAWFTWFIVRTQVQRTLNLQRKELEVARQQVQMGNETIMAIAKAVDAKDERTAQHSQRVSEYSVLIGRELGFSEAECENLRKAARMHDIGKIGIPDNILNKPARLTDEEYAVMKSHVVRGGEILKDFTLIDHVVEGALYHHERYDGRGYPEGLKGEGIPLYGRIIGVADAFDAMTANRVYRKQMDFDYVLNEMRNGRGTQFDPQMVDILLKLIDDGKIDLNELYPQSTDDAQA